jgi:hypothetical protein
MTAMMKSGQTNASTYSFSSQPKAVSANRKKYRDPNEVVDEAMYRDPKETCITWDKRVHRGNTYSMYTQNAIKEALEQAENPPAPPMYRKRRPKEKNLFDMGMPEKERIPVDLTDNLIAKEVIPVLDSVEAQTDEFLPEQPAEQYQPQKTGVDQTTQVEDGELFVFDYEVEPILEVLINKTLEQSIMEVEEEFELDQMTEFRTEWMKRQAAMMKDWEAQVAEEWVLWNKKEEVLRQKREEKRREAQVLLKIQALNAAKAHLKNLVPNAVQSLQEEAFPDMKNMAVSHIFMPQICQEVRQQVQSRKSAEGIIGDILSKKIKATQAKQKSARQVLVDKWNVLEAKRLEEAKTRRGNIRIYVPDADGTPVPVGPVQISSEDTIEAVQDLVFEWLQANEPRLVEVFPWGVIMAMKDENGEVVPITETAQMFEAKAGQISMLPQQPPPPVDEPVEGAEAGAFPDESAESGEAAEAAEES